MPLFASAPRASVSSHGHATSALPAHLQLSLAARQAVMSKAWQQQSMALVSRLSATKLSSRHVVSSLVTSQLTTVPCAARLGAVSTRAGLAAVDCRPYPGHFYAVHVPQAAEAALTLLLPDSLPAVQHGLGLSAAELAWPLSSAGATLVLFALFVIPRLQKRISHGSV